MLLLSLKEKKKRKGNICHCRNQCRIFKEPHITDLVKLLPVSLSIVCTYICKDKYVSTEKCQGFLLEKE